LDDSVPDIIFYLGILNKINHDINIPDEIFCKHFCENGNFQNKIIANKRIVSCFQISKQLRDNYTDIVVVADEIEKIKRSSSNGNVTIIKVRKDFLQML
jgi:hypothetical protein